MSSTKVATINNESGASGDGAAMVSMIERMASDPSVDVDKLQRLLEMRKDMQAQEAQTAFNAAMTEAQSEIGRVAADKQNQQTHSDYASYAALDRVVRPIYTKHGFALSFDTGDAPEGMVRVLCYVSHSAGHTKTYRIDMPADGKGAKGGDVMTKTHATGSGTAYGQRYLLKLIFNVAIGKDPDDDDGNAAGATEPDADQSWYDAIEAATDMTGLNKIAADLKKNPLAGRALRNVRAAWAKRSKEVTA